ncbi:MAG: S8 family peptidase [Reichenbachiella sp.]|uniref:S8 family peptidase n=1 Tax=Reichenbachiella sp. TaxID=2184521 RepID=UPI0032644129
MPDNQNNIAFLPGYDVLSVHEDLASFNNDEFENFDFASNQRIDWGLQRHLIPELWGITKGEGIKVAVLDTGVAPHEDLGNDIVQKDFTGEEGIKDGHGTLVAGIIGARDNEIGIVGVAPKCELYSAKVLKNNGDDKVEPIIKGLKWAIDEVGVDIISMSLHIAGYSQEMHDLIKRANDEGKFVICAAGNKGSALNALNYPAKYDETIAVGSIANNFQMAYSSSEGVELDVVAPGIDICSTDLDQNYSLVQGTSFATPFVSGVVALMLAKHRMYESHSDVTNAQQLKEHLRRTSIDVGPCGFDRRSGFGLINPKSLVMRTMLRD